MRLHTSLCLLLVIPVVPILRPHVPAGARQASVTPAAAASSPCMAAEAPQAVTASDAFHPFPVVPAVAQVQAVTGLTSPTYLTESLWLSPHQVINSTSGTSGFAIFDGATGRQTPLDQLDAIVSSQESGFNPFEVRLSPDGHWLLTPSGSKAGPTWIALSVDGTDRREWPRTVNTADTAWMQDGRHWVEIFDARSELPALARATAPLQYKVRVYDTASPNVKEFPLMPDPSDGMFVLPMQCAFGQFLFTQDGRAWISTVSEGSGPTPPFPFDGPHLDAYELVPGETNWTLHKSQVRFAADVDIGSCGGCVRSPDGNWLAWRNCASTGKGPRRLVLTRPDGSDPQTVLESPEGENLCYVHWTENSQAIAFYKDNGLYRLPLEDVEAKANAQCGAWRTASGGHPQGKFPRPWTKCLTASRK